VRTNKDNWEEGGVGDKQDVHFCRIGNTILTIKELDLGEICETYETQNVQFADFAFRTFCIYLYGILSGRLWCGGGKEGIFKTLTKRVRGNKFSFWSDVFDE